MQFLKASTDMYIPDQKIKYISDCNGKVARKLITEKKEKISVLMQLMEKEQKALFY